MASGQVWSRSRFRWWNRAAVIEKIRWIAAHLVEPEKRDVPVHRGVLDASRHDRGGELLEAAADLAFSIVDR